MKRILYGNSLLQKTTSWIQETSQEYLMRMLMENLGNRNLEQGGSWTQGIFIILKKKSNFSPSIDLFASRLNTQLPEFVSYQPDPES